MLYLALRTRIAQICGMAGSGADSVEEWALVGDMANEAVRDILLRTRINVRCVDITLTGGADEYDLGTSVLRINNLYRGTTELGEVENGDLSRFADAGSGGAFTVIGFNRIKLSWEPETGDELEAWYTPAPTPMAADGDNPAQAAYGSIPEVFHPAIVNYSCWKLADVVGDMGSGRGDKYKAWYEGQDGLGGPGTDLGKIKYAINRRGASGSRRGRMRRASDVLSGDASPDQWVG